MGQRVRDANGKGRTTGASLPRALQDGVLATDLGDEVVLYDSKQHRGHCLNKSAAVVWRNLDGQKSMSDVVARLRQEIDASADENAVWVAVAELQQAELLEGAVKVPGGVVSRRKLLAAGAVVVPAVLSMTAPPAHAQVSAVGCSPPDTCATFTCPGGCACVPTTEGTTVCIVPTCVAPCTTTADCPPGTVCFTLGCCGPATYCVPIAPAGTSCGPSPDKAWKKK